jgi:hypothetical protein
MLFSEVVNSSIFICVGDSLWIPEKFISCFSSIDFESDFKLSGIGCVYNEFDLDPTSTSVKQFAFPSARYATLASRLQQQSILAAPLSHQMMFSSTHNVFILVASLFILLASQGFLYTYA